MLFPLDTGIAICAYLYNLYGFFLHDRNQLRNFIISSSADCGNSKIFDQYFSNIWRKESR